MRRVKVRKLMGWDKDSWIGKAQATCTSKAEQGFHSLLPISRQMFSHPQESRAPPLIAVTLEDKHRHSKCPPLPSSSPSILLLSIMSHGMEYPFGHLASAVPVVSPPSFLCTPSLLAGGVGWEGEKALTLCKHCAEVTVASLYYQHCFQQ